MRECMKRNVHAASTKECEAARSQMDQTPATASATNRATENATCAPNRSTPRANAGRSVPQYSFHERTMRVSWPQSATTEKNDIALKMMASEPKLAGSIDRDASANMVKPRTDAENLRVNAAALPFNTWLSRKYCAIFLTMSPSLMAIEAGLPADIAADRAASDR